MGQNPLSLKRNCIYLFDEPKRIRSGRTITGTKMSSMYWCDFIAGWVGGKFLKNILPAVLVYYFISVKKKKYNILRTKNLRIKKTNTGCAGVVVGHPFDTLKVRQQAFANAKLSGLTMEMLRNEGVKSDRNHHRKWNSGQVN